MSDRNFGPLSGGSPFIAIATGSPTDIHAVGAAVVGQLRGHLVHLHVSNSNAASRNLTLSDGTSSEVIAIPANGVVEMDFWLGAGETITGQASDTDVQVMGYVRPIG